MANEYVSKFELYVEWEILESRDLGFARLVLVLPWERVDLNKHIKRIHSLEEDNLLSGR